MPDESNDEIDVEALQAQLASFSVEQFLVSAASTIASLAYAKLERRDFRAGAQGDRRPRRRSCPTWRASWRTTWPWP